MSAEDIAQEIELRQWEFNNRSRGQVKYSVGEAGYGPEDCDECGNEMPTVRREYGFRLCVGCQSLRENAAR